MLRSALRSFPGKAPLCSAPGSGSGSVIFPGLSVVEGGVKRRLVLVSTGIRITTSLLSERPPQSFYKTAKRA